MLTKWQDPEFMKQYRYQWHKNNPDKVKIYNERNRVRMRERYWYDEEYRLAFIEKEKQRMQNPDYRTRALKRMRRCDRKREIDFREKVVQALGNKCQICGQTDIRVLEVHHPNGRHGKPGMRSHMLELSLRHGEILQLLCANCHRIIHWRREQP